MDGGRLERIEELYHAAREREAGERAAFLRDACRSDEGLRLEVEALLAQDVLSGPLERPAWAAPEGQGSSEFLPPAEGQATTIGRYHLLQKIGEGGMGEVWLAEQSEPVRRRVALKVVKTGMNTREVMARFESERQALALMDHPAIATVFDADSTPQGTPYFAMEYVAGVPITAYCDNHRLTTPERLQLFTRVCEGVQHAHQKAIIHRDLKPSNVLVTEVDGRPTPKIIDFGIAKALTQKLTPDTIFTRLGAVIGTPEYMSPEQALSSGEDIDTRTDVYSLGVILYELLAGAPPIELRKVTFEEFLRRLREEEPPKPSTKIRTTNAAIAMETARKRQTEPVALARQIRGDLDSIVLKALEKDRARRYGSPSDLAADIGLYLNDEPVRAMPPSVAYRARKFARRNRAALITAAAVALVLIAAAAVSIRQSIRASSEAAVAQAVNDFLQNDLLAQASAASQSGPGRKPDPDVKARTLLDRAAARIKGRFDRQPEVEAAVRDTIGQTYMDLGLYPEARTQLERALEVRRRVLGVKNPQTLKTMGRLGYTAFLQGKYPEAEALLTQTLKMQRRVLGLENLDTLLSMNYLGTVYRAEEKYPQAETLDRQTLEIRRRVLGPEHPDTLKSMGNLATVYQEEGKYAPAEALQTQTQESLRRVLGPEHPTTLQSMNNLATVYRHEGDYARAEALDTQVLEIRRRVLGPEHPSTLQSMINLANAYSDQDKYVQAASLESQILEIQRRTLGPEHHDTLISMNNLAEDLRAQGKYAEAVVLSSQALEIERRVLGPEHRYTLDSMGSVAAAYAAEGKYAQAEPLLRQAVDSARRVLGPEDPDSLAMASYAASMYQWQGRFGLAESYATEVLAGRRHALGSDHPDTMTASEDLALAYLSQGKFTEAEPLAREALEFNRKQQPDNWQRFRAESLLGKSLAGQKKYADAEPLLVDGYQGMLSRKERIAMPDRYHLERAHEWVVQLHRAWKKPQKAEEWPKK
ncbi:MAG TPA: serine/threonine-protein kinase [Terriglobia bacterium]|jgi:tetratricopeptide (TPR) repeat protein|nr:serine/threonine-protein kinase [Terriglobia bacterium]